MHRRKKATLVAASTAGAVCLGLAVLSPNPRALYYRFRLVAKEDYLIEFLDLPESEARKSALERFARTKAGRERIGALYFAEVGALDRFRGAETDPLNRRRSLNAICYFFRDNGRFLEVGFVQPSHFEYLVNRPPDVANERLRHLHTLLSDAGETHEPVQCRPYPFAVLSEDRSAEFTSNGNVLVMLRDCEFFGRLVQ